MKDYKTTLMGFMAGLPMAIDAVVNAYASGQFVGKTGWQLYIAFAIILLGVFAGDSKTPVNTNSNQ